MTTHFDFNEIAERIVVQKPYFALNALCHENIWWTVFSPSKS